MKQTQKSKDTCTTIEEPETSERIKNSPEAIVLIGQTSRAESVRDGLRRAGLDAEPISVDDYLMALGEAAESEASIVIGSVSDIDGSVEAAVHGLRRVAPSIRVIVTVPPDLHDQKRQLVYTVADACLTEPLDADDVAAAIRNGNGNGIRRYVRFDQDQKIPRMETKQRIDSESNRSGPSLDLNESSLAGAPGDVDLVARVLDQDSEGLKTAAIAAVRAHAGIPDADWAKRLDLVPGGHAKVAVECRGQQLGVLHAPRPISVDQLQPWASWLGWWLALDKQSQQLTHDSTHDDLTGLCNRRHFRQFLESILHKATSERFHVTLLVFDLDEFKTYNDRFGHAAGDEILRETARLIQSSVREHDVVARIGGDEFAVVFWDRAGPRRPNSQHPNDVLRAAERFRKAICGHRFPKLGAEAPGALTVSAGLAGFPWDGRTPEELLDKADQMALRSKRQGKNAISLGPGAARHCKVPKT